MMGMVCSGALFVCAFFTARYVEDSDILVAGMLIASALFYIGMHLSVLVSKNSEETDKYRERSA